KARAADQQGGEGDPGQQRKERLVVPAPGAAVQRLAEQPAGQQRGGQQPEAGGSEAEGQALERQQRNAAVVVGRQADALFGVVHQGRMHGGRGEQAIGSDAQRQVQRQPGGGIDVQRQAGKQRRQ